MPEVYSELLGNMCDSHSDQWRHECECRWLLAEKPEAVQLSLYLYGVEYRDRAVTKDAAGVDRLIPDQSRIWKDPAAKPISAHRGLQGADRLLHDVLKLKELRSVATGPSPEAIETVRPAASTDKALVKRAQKRSQ